MPKPRMKKFDLKDVGGRIRKARIDASLTMKELSEKMEVSFAYLGMVERGEKKPSDRILACVAETTGVSLDWLQNGDNDSVDNKPQKSNQPQPPRYIADIDPALFLSLVMLEEPSVSEEMIAAFLNVDHDTLKNILDGTLKFDPAWKSAFTTLAQRLKIPDVLNKLRTLIAFFERVETEKIDIALIKAIGNSLSNEFHDEFTYFDKPDGYWEYVDIKESYKGEGVPVRSFTFAQKSTTARWNVALYSELHGSLLEQLISTLKHPSDNIVINENDGTASIDKTCGIQNEVIVFIKEENFREALSYAGVPDCNGDDIPKVAVMRLDPDAMLITDCEKI